MKKWKLLAITEYFIPIIFVILVSLVVKWNNDIENYIFAFILGTAIQFIIGICGFIRIGKRNRGKVRLLFLISIFPFLFIILLYIISRSYSV